MNDELEDPLTDVLAKCRSIKEFVSDHSFESYQGDDKTRFAVERCFEVIGEALSRIGRIDNTLLESIRDYRAIRSFRNILAHAYDHVEDKIV